ncbi:MAG TPA: histidine ammonia-lyase [Terriglobia bacterium]|nr:histidine ammonia-lyase [Terriglobia bacterium]
MAQPILLTGSTLTRNGFYSVVFERRTVALHPRARMAMARTRALIEAMIQQKQVVYGVTTGVGSLSTERIDPAQARQLQLNIVRSHACGVGEPLDAAETRALLLLRANGLAAGLSGVRPAVVELLCRFLNHGIHPVVPSRGSVGASGDLAPLAHLARTLVGEGEVVYQPRPRQTARRIKASEAFKRTKLRPLELRAKEGLSLVNGTQAMLALGLIGLKHAETLVETADVAGALSLDALRGSPAAFDERLQMARPHPGQMTTAKNLVRLNRGSTIRRSHRDCPRVQDAYSLRCMPQVHGAVRDALGYARRVFDVEMNSATDNPLIFVREGEVVSGGNFHGAPLATALDLMAIVLTQLGSISERRIDRMVNPLTSDLPPFLAHSPGLESGFMLAQVTAAALASENKILAHPASVDSIPTSGNKEDFVSMGMAAALKLRPILSNVLAILSIELLAASEAIDRLAPLKTGLRAERARRLVRAVARPLNADRALDRDIARVADLISQERFSEIAAR